MSYTLLNSTSYTRLDLGTTVSPTEIQDWMLLSNKITWYAIPIVIGLSFVCGLFNATILAIQLIQSQDVYLLGGVVASTFLCVFSGLLRLYHYLPCLRDLTYATSYLNGGRDWFVYIIPWLLLVISLERSMTILQNRHCSTCTRIQAAITTVVTYLICFISAMPEFWRYNIKSIKNVVSNGTTLVAIETTVARNDEYRVIYHWYTVTLEVFLPYPVLFILSLVLAKSMSRSKRPPTNRRDRTSLMLNRKYADQADFSKLPIALNVAYLIFTGPLAILELIPRLSSNVVRKESESFKAVSNIFTVVYFCYFLSVHPILYRYGKTFRKTTRNKICCRKCRHNEYNLHTAELLPYH